MTQIERAKQFLRNKIVEHIQEDDFSPRYISSIAHVLGSVIDFADEIKYEECTEEKVKALVDQIYDNTFVTKEYEDDNEFALFRIEVDNVIKEAFQIEEAFE